MRSVAGQSGPFIVPLALTSSTPEKMWALANPSRPSTFSASVRSKFCAGSAPPRTALTLGVYHRAQTVRIERVGLQAHAVNIAHGPRMGFGNAPRTSFHSWRSAFVAHREHPPPWSRLCLDDDDGVASLLKFESRR